VAAAFAARGLPGVHVDSRQVLLTDTSYMRAVPQFDETNERLRKKVQPLLEAGKVPVMGDSLVRIAPHHDHHRPRRLGFFRGDFGAGLNAERIEIWTDVDGMMTTDPRLCPDAAASSSSALMKPLNLPTSGRRFCIRQPCCRGAANIPVYVLNSLNPTCEGTKITARAPRCSNIFKAIALKKKITLVEVASPRRLLVHGYLKSIFEAFDLHDIAVDVFPPPKSASL